MGLFDNNRTVLITGASSGIGVELARLFAENGDRLILVARREDRLKALAAELTDKHKVQASYFAADLAKPEGPKQLAIEVGRKGHVVDILVNNAGFGLSGRFAKLPLDRQLAMIQVNIAAPTALAGLFLPGMLARGRGGVLNVASLAAFQAGPGMAVYYATKAYLLSLSEALYEEARDKGVAVTALCPGPVPTEFGEVSGMKVPKQFDSAAVTAAEAARVGYEALRAGKAIAVPGALPKVAALMTRFGPRGLNRRIAGAVQGFE